MTGTTERMREMLRKPYVVYGYIYSNGIHKADIEELTRVGFLNKGKWASALEQSTHSEAERGELVFQGEGYEVATARSIN